ncbi:MAG: dCTP deaminase [Desulfurococcales archaeon]|nr:dCTP deaminase [Desulfurococcales archaeon]
MLLSDRDILALIRLGELVVEPLFDDTVRENGLDLRLGRGYCLLRPRRGVVDPEEPPGPLELYDCREAGAGGIVVPPGRRVLLHTLEYIRLPPYLAGLVNLRSTWARLGIYIPATVVDAGFEGQLTIEVVGSEFPVRLRPGQRFLHLVLARLATPAANPYSGAYKGQRGVRLPKIFETHTTR